MKIVIDKDFSERKMLNESFENERPTYVVKAINESDKFVYAKGLKKIDEAVDATYDLAFEPIFDDCKYEISSCVCGKTTPIWSSDTGTLVSESEVIGEAKPQANAKGKAGSEEGGFFAKLGAKAKQALDGLKKGINVVGAMTKQFSKDMLKKWREAGYFNKQGYITGLGYKVMTGQVKNTIPVDTGSDKTQDISNVWKSAQSNVVQALKKQGMTVNGEIKAIVKNDKDAILLTANVKSKDGDEQTLTFDQDGQTVDGNGAAVDPTQGAGDANGGGNGGGNSANTQKITPEQAQKNPKAALGNLATRVANIEKEIGITSESIDSKMPTQWYFGNERLRDRMSFERKVISTFFRELNSDDVNEIVFIDSNKTVNKYKPESSSYSRFKKDFKTNVEIENFKHDIYRVDVDFGDKDGRELSGYKMSDFGGDDDVGNRIVSFEVSLDDRKEFKPNDDSDSEEKQDVMLQESTASSSKKSDKVVNESLVLEMDGVDTKGQMDVLVDSIKKYGGVVGNPVNGTPTTVYGDTLNGTMVTEEGEEEAQADDGGDADPFADSGGDAGGGDEAGGDADPFADDEGGGEGGEEGGGDSDPFADDAGGGEEEAEPAEQAPEGGAEDSTGEPAPEQAINTDAQGNPKSQYNINVTKPFNVDDSFSLTEDEQKEFFGKIDQLVKIPDMENYSLYLYQITPDNVNLDDVHYITSLYELSVKLGLLEDTYADSNLLEKYSSYKYSVLKNGDDSTDNLEIQESKYKLFESKNDLKKKTKKTKSANTKSAVQKDNEEKTDVDKVDSERRGPENAKLNKDENGADKPIVIDTNDYGWENKNKKLFGSSEEGDFHGLGWVVTFKAMQFGSPRFMSMYIKKNGDEKAEVQCKNYLEKLSYSDIEIVHIEDIDPYEYVYRNSASGMKSVEEIQTSKFANKDIPFMENTSSIPKDIQRDIKGVLTKLNAEIRNTKQFNFLKECGVEKPQLEAKEFLECYKTAQVDENVGDTTYKFILKKNDSVMSRMFFSNMKEKLFRYLGTFATKYNMECGCEETPTCICIDFVRSELNNPMGYDLDTMVNIEQDALPEVQAM